MYAKQPFEIQCEVIKEQPSGIFQIILPNQHQATAQLSHQMKEKLNRILPGHCVLVKFHPYDLNHGQILGPIA